MCGIAGYYFQNKILNDAGFSLEQAASKIKHRGPDAQKTISLENKKIFLAHTRLKIIDVSDNANQPFFSPCGFKP